MSEFRKRFAEELTERESKILAAIDDGLKATKNVFVSCPHCNRKSQVAVTDTKAAIEAARFLSEQGLVGRVSPLRMPGASASSSSESATATTTSTSSRRSMFPRPSSLLISMAGHKTPKRARPPWARCSCGTIAITRTGVYCARCFEAAVTDLLEQEPEHAPVFARVGVNLEPEAE
jgi:hypothetical protein